MGDFGREREREVLGLKEKWDRDGMGGAASRTSFSSRLNVGL